MEVEIEDTTVEMPVEAENNDLSGSGEDSGVDSYEDEEDDSPVVVKPVEEILTDFMATQQLPQTKQEEIMAAYRTSQTASTPQVDIPGSEKNEDIGRLAQVLSQMREEKRKENTTNENVQFKPDSFTRPAVNPSSFEGSFTDTQSTCTTEASTRTTEAIQVERVANALRRTVPENNPREPLPSPSAAQIMDAGQPAAVLNLLCTKKKWFLRFSEGPPSGPQSDIV